MKKLATMVCALTVLVRASASTCGTVNPKPKQVCTPGETRERLPDHPGKYEYFLPSGTGWSKVQSPTKSSK